MNYFVHILTNLHHTVLYTGITNNLEDRVFDHKVKRDPKSFTARYNCQYLVYYEEFSNIQLAIQREKQLKRYRRIWKEKLIKDFNPSWADLSREWFNPKEFELFKRFDR